MILPKDTYLIQSIDEEKKLINRLEREASVDDQYPSDTYPQIIVVDRNFNNDFMWFSIRRIILNKFYHE